MAPDRASATRLSHGLGRCHLRADVLLAALTGQLHLALALGEASPIRIAKAIDAMGAAHPWQ